MLPVGVCAFWFFRNVATSPSFRPWCASWSGFTSTRTAGRDEPPTSTCPTPGTCDSVWARIVEAES